MLTGNFTDLLMTAKRRAQLSGRPLTSRETAGIVEGYASTASDRLYRQKVLEEEKRRTNLQVKEAKRARRAERKETISTLIGGGVGYALAPAKASVAPYIIGGMMIGEMIGGATWLCTKVKNQIGLTDEQQNTLDDFREYAKEHHNGWLDFYVRIGPEIVNKISKVENEKPFYENLKKTMIEQVIQLFNKGKKEAAFNLYRIYVLSFIEKYVPRYIEEAEVVDRIDFEEGI